jgi:alpha-ketoglutarate-dependent taurine dioxygenase
MAAASFELRPIGRFGVEAVTAGSDGCAAAPLVATRLIDSPADCAALRLALAEHAVLVLRLGTQLDEATHRSLQEVFGEVKERKGLTRSGDVLEYNPQLAVQDSSVRDDGTGGPGAVHFHTDDSYLPNPCRFTSLHSREPPVHGGGGTEFLNMRIGWEALTSAEQAQLRPLTATHVHVQGPIRAKLIGESGYWLLARGEQGGQKKSLS